MMVCPDIPIVDSRCLTVLHFSFKNVLPVQKAAARTLCVYLRYNRKQEQRHEVIQKLIERKPSFSLDYLKGNLYLNEKWIIFKVKLYPISSMRGQYLEYRTISFVTRHYSKCIENFWECTQLRLCRRFVIYWKIVQSMLLGSNIFIAEAATLCKVWFLSESRMLEASI